jgi:hypothetical protein
VDDLTSNTKVPTNLNHKDSLIFRFKKFCGFTLATNIIVVSSQRSASVEKSCDTYLTVVANEVRKARLHLYLFFKNKSGL